MKAYDRYIYVVKYDISRGGFVPFACGDGVASADYSEVIGNVWENGELLNDCK